MKRRWFQVHLSTAMVMMVLASGLLGVSLWFVENHSAGSPVNGKYFYASGWPIYSSAYVSDLFIGPNGTELIFPGEYKKNSFALVFNIGINLSIVLMSGAILEVVIRRKNRAS